MVIVSCSSEGADNARTAVSYITICSHECKVKGYVRQQVEAVCLPGSTPGQLPAVIVNARATCCLVDYTHAKIEMWWRSGFLMPGSHPVTISKPLSNKDGSPKLVG